MSIMAVCTCGLIWMCDVILVYVLQVKALAPQVVHASKIAFENPENQVSVTKPQSFIYHAFGYCEICLQFSIIIAYRNNDYRL